MDKQDFVNCATRIVDQYMEGSCELSDGVLKEAQARQLTSQQIMVLSNFTNTIAHTQSWRKLAEERAPDRYVAFTPVDPDVIIKLAGQPARDGGAGDAEGPTVVRGGLDKVASAPPTARDVFVPGIVPDQRWEQKQAAYMEKVAADQAEVVETFSTDLLPRPMSKAAAVEQLRQIQRQAEDEIMVGYAAYDLELCKIGQYLRDLPGEDVAERVRDIYAVDPSRSDKIATILSHLQESGVRSYPVYNSAALLEQHATNVKLAAWHLTLSPLPIRDNVMAALDHLDHLQKLGTAHSFLEAKLR